MQSLIVCTAFIIFYTKLFKSELRFSKWKTIIILALFYYGTIAIEQAVPRSAVYETVWVLLWYAALLGLVRERAAENLIAYILWEAVSSILQTIALAAAQVLASGLRGNVTWYVQNEGGIGMLIFGYCSYAAACTAAYCIVRRVKPIIETMPESFLKALFLLLPSVSLFCSILKNASLQMKEYTNDPGGWMMAVDIVMAACWLTGIFLIAGYMLGERRKENRKIKEQISRDYNDYMEIVELRQEIRELNHDLRSLSCGQEKENGC